MPSETTFSDGIVFVFCIQIGVETDRLQAKWIWASLGLFLWAKPMLLLKGFSPRRYD